MMITPGAFAPLSVLLFLGSAGLLAVTLTASLWFRRRDPVLSRRLRLGGVVVVGLYLAALGGAGLASREEVLAPNAEKYFCELDCHLAYRVMAVAPVTAGGARRVAVVLRTRFDETTIAPWRPREAPTWPAPRRVALVQPDGRRVAPVEDLAAVAATGVQSTPISRELRPGESYETVLVFDVATTAGDRLWIADDLGVSPWLIGHERSPFHSKVLLPLPAGTVPAP